MQFILHFHANNPLILPIGYHSEVQGLIYHILSRNPAYSKFLHNEGYSLGGRKFKLFVFSLLYGKYTIDMPNIIFQNDFSLEVRSPKQNFCEIFSGALLTENHFELNRQPICLTSFETRKDKIEENCVRIDMISPVCLHRTEDSGGGRTKTIYLNPLDEDYNSYLNSNFVHKLLACEGRIPYGEIHLSPLYPDHGHMQKRDKYVTRFAGHIVINAWRGKYQLSGDPRDLTILYDTGLGSKNSQGFGMFKIL